MKLSTVTSTTLPIIREQNIASLPVLPSPGLVRVRKSRLPVLARREAGKQRLTQLPAKRTYTATRGSGRISKLWGDSLETGKRIEIELPPGTPGVVLVPTFKRLLGGSVRETLLRRTKEGWVICPDDERVDLGNTAIEFRIGAIAVLS